MVSMKKLLLLFCISNKICKISELQGTYRNFLDNHILRQFLSNNRFATVEFGNYNFAAIFFLPL